MLRHSISVQSRCCWRVQFFISVEVDLYPAFAKQLKNNNIQVTLVGKYRLVLNCLSVDDSVTVEKNKMTDQKRTSGT